MAGKKKSAKSAKSAPVSAPTQDRYMEGFLAGRDAAAAVAAAAASSEQAEHNGTPWVNCANKIAEEIAKLDLAEAP